MAAVCLSVCGVTFFSLIDGQLRLLRRSCAWRRAVRRRRGRAGRRPGWGTAGMPGTGPSSASQVFSTLTAWLVSGVARSLRPLPWQRTCGPAPRCASWRARPVSSDTRSPVWTASRSRAWSRRPCQVCPVGGGEQRVGFLRGEVADDGALAAAGRDGQDLADHGGVLGCPRGRVAEQRVDRGQPGVAGGAAVSPLVLEVLQELPDQRGVEVGEAEPAGCCPGPLLSEGEQELARVAVGRDRVRAGLLLPGEPVGEEPLQDGGEVAHGASRPSACSSRPAARARSPGTAWRYQ